MHIYCEEFYIYIQFAEFLYIKHTRNYLNVCLIFVEIFVVRKVKKADEGDV